MPPPSARCRTGLCRRRQRVLMKLIVSQGNRKVLGCHIVAPGAGEMIQLAGVAVKMGATKEDFDRTVAVHPTMSEEIVTMKEPVRTLDFWAFRCTGYRHKRRSPAQMKGIDSHGWTILAAPGAAAATSGGGNGRRRAATTVATGATSPGTGPANARNRRDREKGPGPAARPDGRSWWSAATAPAADGEGPSFGKGTWVLGGLIALILWGCRQLLHRPPRGTGGRAVPWEFYGRRTPA
jgi:hypothetical protein